MVPPGEYQRATDHFYAFLADARDIAGFTTMNPAYTMTQGVFQAFRRRMELRDAIRFANVLPVGLRALFVADWDPDEPRREFEDRETMTKEVQSLRAEHNYSPDTAIRDVAVALRKHVRQNALDGVLARLPAPAAEFWQT
jgi:uncharacterized protein (DUF2267 family)